MKPFCKRNKPLFVRRYIFPTLLTLITVAEVPVVCRMYCVSTKFYGAYIFIYMFSYKIIRKL